MQLRVLDIVWILVCLAMNATAENRAVFINGGYDASSNYIQHENDIRVFYQLFGSQLTVLNAGDTENNRTKVVTTDNSGVSVRNGNGLPAYRYSSLTMPTKAATTENIADTLNSVADENNNSVTLIWGDHANSERISLWDGVFNFDDVRYQQKRFSSNTWVRSIHLHCYAGAFLVDPEREVPESGRGFKKFLLSNYPRTRCGVATSAPDELGQYLSNSTNISQNPLGGLFQISPHPSLKQIKDVVAALPNSYTTPLLTSDLLVQDILSFWCKKYPPAAPEDGNGHEGHVAGRTLVTPCGQTNTEQWVSHYSDQITAVDSFIDNLKRARRTIRNALIAKAEKLEDLDEDELEKHEDDLAKAITGGKPLNSLPNNISIKEMADTDDNSVSEQQFTYFLNDFLDTTQGKKWLKKLKSQSGKEYQILTDVRSELSGASLNKRIQIEMQKETELSKKRRGYLLQTQNMRRQFVESVVLRQEGNEDWRARYESIQTCENSSIH